MDVKRWGELALTYLKREHPFKHVVTIITASGNTLLGADDKAGIAEIMTALEFLRGGIIE